MDNTLGKNQKDSKVSTTDVVMTVSIAIVGFSLLIMLPRLRAPWNFILAGDIAILLAVELICLKKLFRKQEIIEKSNTILEWVEPRNAWHITEGRWFSPIMLALWFAIGFVAFFLSLAVFMKLHPPVRVDKDTLTFADLPAFSAGCSAFLVAVYASLWWWARLKVKLTTSGVARTFHNSTKTWKYERIKSYHFEPLSSKANVYTLVILRNHKGKTWKITLHNSADKAKIEEIFKKHGVPKLEPAT